jgi:hypothetical protein
MVTVAFVPVALQEIQARIVDKVAAEFEGENVQDSTESGVEKVI